jgi:hypothetical protein
MGERGYRTDPTYSQPQRYTESKLLRFGRAPKLAKARQVAPRPAPHPATPPRTSSPARGACSTVPFSRRFAKNLVSSRIFHLKRQSSIRCGMLICAIERQRAQVDGLRWLIDRLLAAKQDRQLILYATDAFE